MRSPVACLPAELLSRILKLLNVKQRVKCRLVCREWADQLCKPGVSTGLRELGQQVSCICRKHAAGPASYRDCAGARLLGKDLSACSPSGLQEAY